ncbi:MAG: chromosome segregation protein SMC [Ruminococcaceae bacterium]|nr:chromosome segregation protein SMC [Oscillospiraceae bacterium]
MRLKSLELQGFKSFPDKTTLYFDDGATVIVGPNGSGKSNITDAMRWVLGELSTKTLRGSKMEDVIFIGTEVRKPMSYAEVSVTFDNSSEEGRINSPYDTITVTRRYFRAGESEYLINKNPCRLRDIHELFMNTGVGREGYSIIGQGRIAEIISKKSEDRRNIFEEAAGIAKSRYQKEDAERKLRATEDNMERVFDIYNEYANRIGPLKTAADKAIKYHELYDKRKEAEVSLWIYDSQKTKADIEKQGQVFQLSEEELEQTDETIRKLETKDAALYEKIIEARKESEAILTQINSCSNTISNLDRELSVMENDVEHAKMSSSAQIEELERINAKKEFCEIEIKEKEANYDRINELLQSAKQEKEVLEKNGGELKLKVDQAEEEIERLFQEIKGLEANANEIVVKLSVLENTQFNGDERREEISNDIAKYRADFDELNDKADAQAKVLAKYEATLSELEERLTATNNEIDEKTEKYEALKEEMNVLKSKQLALRERINALNSMEELFEGYAKSVGFIMNAYKNGEIQGCGTVYGPVSTLISVSNEYISAIETALGAGLQHIVVDNEKTAKSCIMALKENKVGRATFYPISSVSGQNPTQEMLNAKKYKGYIGVADDLIKFDSKFEKIFSSLLGRTVVFDNIDNATEMAKEQNYKVKVVTLDGQIINVGGSFTGGSVKQEGTMLSRSVDIKRMEEEEAELISRIDDIKAVGQKLGERLRELTSIRLADKQQYDLTDTIYRDEKTEYDSLIVKMEFSKNQIEGLEDSTKKLFDEEEKNKNEVEALKLKQVEIKELISTISERRFNIDMEKGETENEVEAIQRKIVNKEIEITAINKDIEAAVAAILSAKERLDEIEADIKERKDKMEQYNEAVSSSGEKKAHNRKLYHDAQERQNNLQCQRDDLLAQIANLEQKRTELNKTYKDIVSKKELVIRSNSESKSHLEQLKLQFDNMVDKLYQDYGLTYSTAVELGYPEVTSENRKEIHALAVECRNKLRALGHVNPNAMDEYKEVKEKYDYYNTQLTDLKSAKEDLTKIIVDMETKMKESFIQAFRAINENFNLVFKELFGGGHAELSLEDENDILNCGIEIKAAPPGKVIKSLMLLSGGEQAFVAIALLFAILKVNPTPFCIFDEIEAALDDVNVARFGQYVKRYSGQTQFIIITHRRGTMEIADRLYGVTMPQKGISKVLTMDVNDVGKDNILKDDGPKQ